MRRRNEAARADILARSLEALRRAGTPLSNSDLAAKLGDPAWIIRSALRDASGRGLIRWNKGGPDHSILWIAPPSASTPSDLSGRAASGSIVDDLVNWKPAHPFPPRQDLLADADGDSN